MHGYLRHLANFALVVDEGSITAAARRLGVVPSSISESVKIIEKRIGAPLLERHPKGMKPTARGMEVYREASVIREALGKALDQDPVDEQGGTLRATIPAELAAFAFASTFMEVKKLYPKLHLVLQSENRILDYQKERRDLIVRVSNQKQFPGMTILEQMQIKTGMYAHSQLVHEIDKADPKAVGKLLLLGSPRATVNRNFKLRSGADLTFDQTLQVDDILTRIVLAKQKVGVITCLECSFNKLVKDGEFVQLFADDFGIPVTATIGTSHRRPPDSVVKIAKMLKCAL